ncbi:hypothetical protein K469DRAFT_739581 [Zopfia rhizophila CBS 207.26]|uniref:Ketopantoate reductase N-terminal domain-containing protein n=1 Tax=Zopfia rhizophila CBS 207.26 TaxID=1314779 RepID=A0A6A6E1W5_9PEZI|nr:hypothetical protein K469DRAFT_739581 [Zopfia rhizophila CBS 207.26]
MTEGKVLTRRVYILGLDSIRSLIAHSLKASADTRPISIFLHRPSLYNEFILRGRTINLTVKMLGNPKRSCSPEKPTAAYIIIVKVPMRVNAERTIKHGVDRNSTICLIQNGMGQIERLNPDVSTNPATRPTYLVGIISHGAHIERNLSVIHAGAGTLFLRKLALNCVPNPLTALLNVPNDSMLDNPLLRSSQRLLLEEISSGLQGLPELKDMTDTPLWFSSERLEELFINLSTATAKNSSSTKEDMR